MWPIPPYRRAMPPPQSDATGTSRTACTTPAMSRSRRISPVSVTIQASSPGYAPSPTTSCVAIRLQRSIRIATPPLSAVSTHSSSGPSVESVEQPFPGVTWLVLRRLDPFHVRAIVGHQIEGRALPADVMEQIIAKTDGVPLFIEELTKAVMESGLLVDGAEGYHLDGPIPPLAIPTTLQDSLIARLDRLAPVKEIAQVGAAIGRDFSYTLLRGIVSRDAVAFDTALAQLEAAELVTRRGEPPEAVYIFKHALVRDAAHASMLKSRRQVLHRRIADVLREDFPAVVETEPETIAHHLTEAGLQEQAIEWWVKAGDRSRSRSAFVETIGHLGRAIELAGHLKDGPAEWSLRLRLQVTYANAQLHARGPAAPEPTMAFVRAREIAAQVDNAPERFAAYYGLFISHYLRGEIASAREVANTGTS